MQQSYWRKRAHAQKNSLDTLLVCLKDFDAIVRSACVALGFKVSIRVIYSTSRELVICCGVPNLDGDEIDQEMSVGDTLCKYFGVYYLKTKRRITDKETGEETVR